MWKSTLALAGCCFHNRASFLPRTRTMRQRTFLSVLLALGLCMGQSDPAFAQSPIVIKFSHVVANDTPKGLAAEYFKQKAHELTKGRVRVEVYSNSALYKDKEEMEALQIGVVQMLAPSLAKFGPLGVKEFEVFDLPYIFDNYDELHKVTQGPTGRQLLDRLEAKGVKGLAYWDNGFKSFSANRPLQDPADFKGLKMRIQASKVLEAQMRALGSVPQVLAFSDVYQALKTSAVDGTENPISNLYTQKMHEVQKHLTLTEHGYLGYAVITNKKFWNGLPADIRKQLEEAMEQSTRYANQIAKLENEKSLEAVRKAGKTKVLVPSQAERLAFKRAMVKVHADMEPRIGKELLQSLYKETGFDPSKL
jgi:C4-dicarboxylate-binding protein DctP